jgi:hypothetical protein
MGPVPATVSTEASRLPTADVAIIINGPRAPLADVAEVLKCATPSVVLIQVKHSVAKTVEDDLQVLEVLEIDFGPLVWLSV